MIVSWFFIFILRITIVLYYVVLYNYKTEKTNYCQTII